MHRTNQVLRPQWWSLFLASLASGIVGAGMAAAQETSPWNVPPLNPPANLVAQKGDDKKDKKDAPADIRDVVVAIGGTQTLEMTTKRPLISVVSEFPNIATAQALVDQPSVMLIRGLQAGVSIVTATDVDGKIERIRVLVQVSIEFLRTVLRQSVPTANIDPIPGGGATIILTGYVAHAEDVDVVLQVARSVAAGAQIINALKVGGVQQVQLDVVVARVARSELRLMGVNFFTSGNDSIFGSTVGNVAGLQGAIGSTSGSLAPGGLIASTPAQNTNLFLGVFGTASAFQGFLQALRTESLAKLLAEPKLTTLSGRSATFLAGGDQAVPVVSGFGGTAGVQFQPFGVRLSFLPIVLGDGKIYIEVEPEVSSLSDANGTPIPGASGVVPGRVTQRVRTSVMMEDGQTFAIGGLILNAVQGTTNKVPVLGDLPFFGALFSTKSYQEIEEELIVLVTPHLVDPSTCDQLPKHLPGRATRTPSDFELFLEGILEAPRGAREVFPHKTYRAAYKNSPTAELYPCAGGRLPGCFGDGSNGHGGAKGCCGPATTSIPLPVKAAAPGQGLTVPVVREPVHIPVGTTEPVPVVPPVAGTPDLVSSSDKDKSAERFPLDPVPLPPGSPR